MLWGQQNFFLVGNRKAEVISDGLFQAYIKRAPDEYTEVTIFSIVLNK